MCGGVGAIERKSFCKKKRHHSENITMSFAYLLLFVRVIISRTLFI